jgi:hypothetical protein
MIEVITVSPQACLLGNTAVAWMTATYLKISGAKCIK